MGSEDEFCRGSCRYFISQTEIAALQSRIDRAWKRLEEWRTTKYDTMALEFDEAIRAMKDAQAILKE
jgi:hypothetical protein